MEYPVHERWETLMRRPTPPTTIISGHAAALYTTPPNQRPPSAFTVVAPGGKNAQTILTEAIDAAASASTAEDSSKQMKAPRKQNRRRKADVTPPPPPFYLSTPPPLPVYAPDGTIISAPVTVASSSSSSSSRLLYDAATNSSYYELQPLKPAQQFLFSSASPLIGSDYGLVDYTQWAFAIEEPPPPVHRHFLQSVTPEPPPFPVQLPLPPPKVEEQPPSSEGPSLVIDVVTVDPPDVQATTLRQLLMANPADVSGGNQQQQQIQPPIVQKPKNKRKWKPRPKKPKTTTTTVVVPATTEVLPLPGVESIIADQTTIAFVDALLASESQRLNGRQEGEPPTAQPPPPPVATKPKRKPKPRAPKKPKLEVADEEQVALAAMLDEVAITLEVETTAGGGEEMTPDQPAQGQDGQLIAAAVEAPKPITKKSKKKAQTVVPGAIRTKKAPKVKKATASSSSSSFSAYDSPFMMGDLLTGGGHGASLLDEEAVLMQILQMPLSLPDFANDYYEPQCLRTASSAVFEEEVDVEGVPINSSCDSGDSDQQGVYSSSTTTASSSSPTDDLLATSLAIAGVVKHEEGEGGEDGEEEEEDLKGFYPCPECDKIFTMTWRLRTHLANVHQKVRPHQCTECEMGFRSPYDLRRHLTTHTGERFGCDACGTTFGSKQRIATHLKTNEKCWPRKGKKLPELRKRHGPRLNIKFN